MEELLYIVARGEDSLYDELARSFADTHDVRIIRDRRTYQRRQDVAPCPAADRRRRDRRVHTRIDEDLRILRWALVRVS